MAQPSTQDIQAPFDPTSYTVITGAGLLQFLDGATPGPDTGFLVLTTDVAGLPQVPDANTNTKWQKYLWVRRQVSSVVGYVWNPGAASDPSLLQWQTISLAAIADGSVTTSKIAAGAVTNDKISSVDWSKITSIPATFMTTGSVAGGDLTGTYPNPVIAANAVTSTKLSSDATVDANRAVGTNHIKDGSVTAAKLATSISLLPAGVIVPFAGSSAPSGWLTCDGSMVLIANAPAMAAAIYVGDGDNSDVTLLWGFKGDGAGVRDTGGLYIKIPDLRGEFVRGWDNGRGVDTGRTLQSHQSDAFKDHTHNSPASSSFATQVVSGGNVASTAGDTLDNPTATGTATAPNNGGTETRPRNFAMNYIIKT